MIVPKSAEVVQEYQGIVEVIGYIQSNANIVCQQSRGTPSEEMACTINQEVQKWIIGDQEQMTQNVEKLIFVLLPS